MNWKNLLDNQCPSCNVYWDEEEPEIVDIEDETDKLIICSGIYCDFKIKESRKAEIISNYNQGEY